MWKIKKRYNKAQTFVLFNTDKPTRVLKYTTLIGAKKKLNLIKRKNKFYRNYKKK